MAYNVSNKRYKPHDKYVKYKFNALSSSTKAINKKMCKRGGIKL